MLTAAPHALSSALQIRRPMRSVSILLILLLAPVVAAQSLTPVKPEPAPIPAAAPEDMKFEIGRTAPSETDRYRALSIGDWGISYSAFYAMHTYNITDIDGLDNSLSSNWLYGMDTFGLGGKLHIEHRLNEEWKLSIIPRLSVAFGWYNTSYHNTFEFDSLPFTSNVRSANDSMKLSVDADVEFAARWRWLWLVGKLNTWSVFRQRHIKANNKVFRDPQLGVLDSVTTPEYTAYEQAYVLGGATGVAFDFFAMSKSTPLIVYLLWLPWNYVEFRGSGGYTNGFEIIVRSTDYNLTDQSGLYLELGIQGLVQIDGEVNDVYFTTFAFGIKWR